MTFRFYIGDKVIKIAGIHNVGKTAIVTEVSKEGHIKVNWESNNTLWEENDFWNKNHFKKVTKLDKILT